MPKTMNHEPRCLRCSETDGSRCTSALRVRMGSLARTVM